MRERPQGECEKVAGYKLQGTRHSIPATCNLQPVT